MVGDKTQIKVTWDTEPDVCRLEVGRGNRRQVLGSSG